MIPNIIEQFELFLLGPDKIVKEQIWSDKVHIIDAHSSIYTIKEQLELYLKVPKCDLFVSPHYNIPILPVKAKRRVVILHDVNHLVFSNQLSLMKRIYAKFVINAAVNRSNSIITISEFSKKEIIKYTGVSARKINVVHYGIDKIMFQQQFSNSKIRELRIKLNLPDNYLLFVGSTKPHKNFIGIINAFASVLKSFPDENLVVLGIRFDEINNELCKIIINNKLKDNLIFPGYIGENDLSYIYHNAKCLIFPSLYEGFGLPPLEAMAAGCPVIASNFASIPEVCNDAALYFDPNNIEDVTTKIESLIRDDNLRLDLIEKGKNNLDRFTPERFSKELNTVLANTINGSN